jgi:hypothetical protein
MTAARMTVLSLSLIVEQGGRPHPVEIAAAFDPIRSPDAARAAGRQIGDLLGEVLDRRIRHGGALEAAA